MITSQFDFTNYFIQSGSWSVRLREILCRIRNQNTAGLEMWSILDQFHHEFNNS